MRDLLNTTFSSLQVRNYRWYWISTLASYAGMQMDMVVRGWLIFQMTGSALALGTVTLASGVPIVVISVFTGAVADRVHKRNMLIMFQSTAAAIALTIAILIATGAIQWWHFIIAAILQGTVFSFIAPLRQALIPELVERKYLLNAVALGSASLNIMRVLGPSLAGILLAVIGAWITYGIVTFSYGLGALLLTMISIPLITGNKRDSVFSDIAQGLRFIRGNRNITLLLITAFIPTVFGLPYIYMMPVLAGGVLKVGETGLGWMMGTIGLGALTGSLAIGSLEAFRRKGLLMILLVLLFSACLCLLSFSGSFALTLVLLYFIGLGATGYFTLNNTLIIHNTPHAMLGRVTSIFWITFGLMPIGAMPMGALAEAVTVPTALLIEGAIVMLFAVMMLIFSKRLRRMQ
jgi:MFS family permease